MKRSLLVLGITLAAALPARADLTHKIQSSVQLDVVGALLLAPSALATATASAGTGVSARLVAQLLACLLVGLVLHTMAWCVHHSLRNTKTSGNSFSFANSYTKATPFQRPLQLLVLFLPLAMSPVQLQGTAGNLAGTITTAGAVT